MIFDKDTAKKTAEVLLLIAGVATGAIGIGMLVAAFLDLPFIYVRPDAKGHGRKNQIEGFIERGQNVVVVEDLISTGKSSLNAVRALKEAGIEIKGMVAIFTYGFDVASKNFEKENVHLNTLSNYESLLEEALENPQKLTLVNHLKMFSTFWPI